MAFNQLNIKIGAVATGLEKTLSQVEKRLNRFGRTMESVGRDLTTRLSLPLGGIGVLAVRAAGDMEQLRLSMEAISDNAEEARAELDKLRRLALEPGISIEQAIKGSINLQSVGFSADEARFALLQFSKAVTLAGGGAEDLEEIVRQFTQIIGKGKILSEDVKVILARVPALRIAFSEAFGGQTLEQIQKSGISTQEFTARIIQAIAANEKFQKVQGGINNAFNNFQQAIKQALGTLGQSIIQTTKLDQVLSVLADAIAGAVRWFDSLDGSTKRIIVVTGLLATAIGPLLIALGSMARLLPILNAGLKAFGITGAAVTAVVGGITYAFFQLVDEFGDVSQAIGFIQAKFTAAFDVIGEGFRRLASGVGGSKTDAQKAGQSLGDVYRKSFEQSIRETTFKLALKNASGPAQAAPDFSNLLAGATAALNAADTGDSGKKAAEPDLSFAIDLKKKIFDLKEQGIELDKIFKKTALSFKPIEELKTNALVQVNNVLAQYGDNVEGLGFANDILSSKIQELQTRIFELAAAGYGPTNEQVIALSANLEILKAKQEEVNTSIERATENSNIFQEALGSVFTELGQTLAQGAADAQAFGKLFAGAIRQAVTELLRLLVAKAIEKALSGSKLLGPLAIPIAAAAGGLAAGLFSSLLRGISFAKGGLVSGPTLALVGEGAGTTGANPEVIAPLDKLKTFLGEGTQRVEVYGVLRGEDIYLTNERAATRINRIR